MKANWKRLIWVIFIYLYTTLFFYNCLHPFKFWVVPYIYTMLMIVWLGVEYYQKHLFFQSGFLPFELYKIPLRGSFALFFYSSFIIGISTIVWWHKNQIGCYPVIHIIGVIMLVGSMYLRWKTLRVRNITTAVFYKFYLSVALLILSVALGYGSHFLVVYTVIIGFSLLFLQYKFEERTFKKFIDFVHNKQKIDKIRVEKYSDLWRKYIEEKSKKNRKK